MDEITKQVLAIEEDLDRALAEAYCCLVLRGMDHKGGYECLGDKDIKEIANNLHNNQVAVYLIERDGTAKNLNIFLQEQEIDVSTSPTRLTYKFSEFLQRILVDGLQIKFYLDGLVEDPFFPEGVVTSSTEITLTFPPME